MDTKSDTALAEAEALAKGKPAEKTRKAMPKKDAKAPVEKTRKKMPAKDAAEKSEADLAKEKAEAAKAEAEKLAKDAAKKAEAEKKKAEKERFKTVTLGNLEKDAKEINVRFEKAEGLSGKADDHRLAAALLLADAKERCREISVSFETWCKDNVKQSYETVRKLIPVGVAEHNEEGAGKLLLTDMRAANAERQKKMKERKAAGIPADPSKGGRRPKLTDEQKKAAEGANGSTAQTKPMSDLERIEAAVNAVPKEARKNAIETAAEKAGMRVVTEQDMKELAAAKKDGMLSPRERIEQLFSRLTSKEQAAVAAWAASQVGGTFTPKA